MSITIDPEFQALIPPLTDDEFRQLKENCVKDGIRDALVTWNGILIDGHNRFKIAAKHGLSWTEKKMEFPDRDAVIAWIAGNQLGRRNLHPLDQEHLLDVKRQAELRSAKTRQGYRSDLHDDFREKFPESGKRVRDIIGEQIGVSGRQVDKLHTINQKASPELKQQVRSGEVSVNGAYQQIRRNEIFSDLDDMKEVPRAKPVIRAAIDGAKERHKDFTEQKKESVVSFQAAQQEKKDLEILAYDLKREIYRAINNINGIGFYRKEKEVAEIGKSMSEPDRKKLISDISTGIGILQAVQNLLKGEQ